MLEYQKSLEENASAEARLAKEAKEHIPAYFGGGFCRMKTPVEISRASEFSTLSCLINFGKSEYRKVEVFIGVYPDYKKEMLIGLPIYATFENGNRAIVNGIVMRKDKGSVNIADFVDGQRMRKLIGENALAINDVAYRYSTAYMMALQASRIREEVEYVNTVDPNTGNSVPVPVATRNIAPPKATDFFAAAGIEIATRLFASIGKDYLYDTRPLFKIYEGKMVWVEGVFEFDTSKIGSRFGNIAENQIKNADKNNESWINERNAVINKYDSTHNNNNIVMPQTRVR
jgi:hypothetical protein